MKAAAEAWGSDPYIFQRGFAEETDDPKVVKATMGKPGVVLRRPVGSDADYTEKAKLPKVPVEDAAPAPRSEPKSGKKPAEPSPDATEKAAAKEAKKQAQERQKKEADRERAEQQERREQAKQEARREKARQERERLTAAADAAFEKAKARHDQAIEDLSRRRKELEQSEADEKSRWEAEERRHKDALDRSPNCPDLVG